MTDVVHGTSDKKVQIRLFGLDSETEKLNNIVLHVPSSTTKGNLVAITKHLLDITDNDSSFEFMVNNHVFGGTLEAFLNDRLISIESIVDIKVFMPDIKPVLEDELSHDEWISCVKFVSLYDKRGMLVTGEFNGQLNIWTKNSESSKYKLLLGKKLGRFSIKSIAVERISIEEDLCEFYVFISEHHNCSVYRLSVKNDSADLTHHKTLQDHTDVIESVLFNSQLNLLATGSWDKRILIYRWLIHENDSEPVVNKVIEGHFSSITDLKIVILDNEKSAQILISSSLDGTIRIWDIESGRQTALINSDSPILSIDIDQSMLFSSHSNHTIRLTNMEKYFQKAQEVGLEDLNENGSNLKYVESVVHSNSVNKIAGLSCGNAGNPHTFVTISSDSFIKIWSERFTSKPMFSQDTSKDALENKLFALDIDRTRRCIFAGGQNTTLYIYSY